MKKRFFLLAALSSLAWGGSIAPFTLNFSQAGGPSALAGTTLASGLNFPYELAVANDGSLLFGQTTTTYPYGLSYGEGFFSTGSAWELPSQGNGSFGSPVAVSGSFSGIATSVKTLSNGVLLVDNGSADESVGGTRVMNFVSPAGQTIGSITFAYPASCSEVCWDHGNGMSLVVPGANGSNTVYFIVGSEFDDAASTSTVSISGLGLNNFTLNADSIYMMTVQSTNGNSVQVTSAPQQIAAGLRNPFALTLDSAGDLLIADNGIDGAHTVNELGADSIDEIPANMIGEEIYDFGFPDSYTNFSTGQVVSGDPNAIPPVVALIPVADSNGTPQNCEGASAIVSLPAGSFSFVGSQGGVIVSCNGGDQAGADNTENAVLYYDFAAGTLIPILDDGTSGLGHISGLALIGNDLFMEDMAASGSQDLQSGLGQGAIYEFDLAAPAPEPGTLATGGLGMCLLAVVKLIVQSKRKLTS